MKEKEHVIDLLVRAKQAALKEDVPELKQLSDMTVHSASVYQDGDNILVAVILYALGKIIEKGKPYYKENYQRYIRSYLEIIDKSISYLKKEDYKNFRNQINFIINSRELSGDLKRHLQGLFRKAKINKAGKVYEHGISMEKTAKLLGISLWELAEYSGQTGINEMKQGKTMNVRDRIKIAEEIFRWKCYLYANIIDLEAK